MDTAHVVATFGPTDGAFVESLAINSHGTAFLTKTVWGNRNTGHIVRVTTTEQKANFGPAARLGAYGMLTGIAINAKDQVFAARYQFGGSTPSEIYRVLPQHLRVVATLPAGSFPNGLTFHKGRLYVSDSAMGAIWRFVPQSATVKHLTTPWLRGLRLQPDSANDLGVNGIAFWGNMLYGVNSSKGLLFRVPLKTDGSAGDVVGVLRGENLVTADGVAFDTLGHLWIVGNGEGKMGTAPPNGQFMVLVTRDGQIWDTTVDASWMNYPTALALGRSPGSSDRMFVSNGAFIGGQASLVSFVLHP